MGEFQQTSAPAVGTLEIYWLSQTTWTCTRTSRNIAAAEHIAILTQRNWLDTTLDRFLQVMHYFVLTKIGYASIFREMEDLYLTKECASERARLPRSCKENPRIEPYFVSKICYKTEKHTMYQHIMCPVYVSVMTVSLLIPQPAAWRQLHLQVQHSKLPSTTLRSTG